MKSNSSIKWFGRNLGSRVLAFLFIAASITLWPGESNTVAALGHSSVNLLAGQRANTFAASLATQTPDENLGLEASVASQLKINLVLAWLWILLGFVSGALLGLNFQREHWLGGYASHRRRLYRLGHISFFGLAVVNLVFVLTVQLMGLPPTGAFLRVASVALVLGAVTMPVSCAVAAHRPGARALFAVPVISLFIGAVCTLSEIIKL